MTHHPWWWPLREAFKKHLDEAHPEKCFENQEELDLWVEEPPYVELKDAQDHQWWCFWSGCQWTINFETNITLKLKVEDEL